jgi:hypothetical protein
VSVCSDDTMPSEDGKNVYCIGNIHIEFRLVPMTLLNSENMPSEDGKNVYCIENIHIEFRLAQQPKQK